MKETVKTDQAPAAIGPYSQAIVAEAGRLVFCSGQIALDPESGEVVGRTAAEQAERVMLNLKAVLEAAGSGFDGVVRTTLYLADIADFAPVNEVYGRFFDSLPPARAAMAVAALPKGARLMIDAVATV
jgi:2-iminobutanoate/2-iminopropanoate deaminase